MVRTTAVILVSATTIIVPLLNAAPAGASQNAGDPNCIHGGNYTSSACLYGVGPQYGDQVDFNLNNMVMNGTLESEGYHINQTLWTFSGSSCNDWVEQGVIQGFEGQVAYLWYYAYNSVYGYNEYADGYTSPTGAAYTYYNQYNGVGADGLGQYVMVRGPVGGPYYEIATVAGLGYGTCIAQAGLEESATSAPPDGNYRSDTFDLTGFVWDDPNGGIHTSGWNTMEYWTDYPCYNGQNPPDCLNGSFYGKSTWADNHPG